MPRESTNSITHLVKLVCYECIDERLADLEHEIRPHVIDATEFLENIQTNLARSGDYWPPGEDEFLKTELVTAIKTIAKNHSRSYAAITSRIHQKNLI